jgi:hypothetical protein
MVGEFMGCGPATAEPIQGTDIEEGQRYGVSQDDVLKNKNILSSSEEEQDVGEKGKRSLEVEEGNISPPLSSSSSFATASSDRRETDEGHHEEKLHAYMLSLCFVYCDTFEHQLDAVVPGGAFSLLKRIREIHDTLGKNLKMVKLAVKLVTPILEQDCSCATFDMENFIEWLSTTPELKLDSFLDYLVLKARDLLYGTSEARHTPWGREGY